MSRLHEEIQEHIHQKECSEINQMIIRIKIHEKDISGESAEQQAKIVNARSRIEAPTWDEMIELLERVHLEMLSCKRPYKRY